MRARAMASVTTALEETRDEIRRSMQALHKKYPQEYWRELDRKGAYPEAFVQELTQGGFLSCLIPEEYGGSGLGVPGGGGRLGREKSVGGAPAASIVAL